MSRYLFIQPDVSAPTGGVNVAIQMVEILQTNGIDANILHASGSYNYKFFRNSTQVYSYSALSEVPISFMGRRNELKMRLKSLLRRDKHNSIKNVPLQLDSNDVIVVPEFWYPEYSVLFPRNKKILLVQSFPPFC